MKTFYNLYRDELTKDESLGKLYKFDEYFGYTLEDEVRPYGEKVYGETAIPENTKDGYKLTLWKSPTMGDVVCIYTHMESGVPVLEYGGIRFTNIYFHGGNRDEDSLGCVLIARNRNSKAHTIQGSMKKDIFESVKAEIKAGRKCRLRVFNRAA